MCSAVRKVYVRWFSYHVLLIYSCIEHGYMNTTEHSSHQRTALRRQLSFARWQVSRSGHQAWWQGLHSMRHLVYPQVENCLSNCNPNQLNATFSQKKKKKIFEKIKKSWQVIKDKYFQLFSSAALRWSSEWWWARRRMNHGQNLSHLPFSWKGIHQGFKCT